MCQHSGLDLCQLGEGYFPAARLFLGIVHNCVYSLLCHFVSFSCHQQRARRSLSSSRSRAAVSWLLFMREKQADKIACVRVSCICCSIWAWSLEGIILLQSPFCIPREKPSFESCASAQHCERMAKDWRVELSTFGAFLPSLDLELMASFSLVFAVVSMLWRLPENRIQRKMVKGHGYEPFVWSCSMGSVSFIVGTTFDLLCTFIRES